MRGTRWLAFLLALSAACRSEPRPASHAAAEPATRQARVVLADGKSPAFAADADAILRELEAWRGLSFARDLLVELVSPDDVADDKLNGWYEPDTKRLVVVEGKTDAMGRGTLLHEMFHALQDQHFDLARLHHEVDGRGADAQRALQALIEGEAMLAVSEIMSYDFEQHTHLSDSGPIDAERFKKVFHYGWGLRFVRALRAQGGWARVDAAFATPPRTTAQIFHPERYLDPSVTLDVPPYPPPYPAPGGAEQSVGGEYEVRLFLAGSEALRPRLDELCASLLSDQRWKTADETVWTMDFSDPEPPKAIHLEAAALGARSIEGLGAHGLSLMIHLAP